jgi:hypothetical protein
VEVLGEERVEVAEQVLEALDEERESPEQLAVEVVQ